MEACCARLDLRLDVWRQLLATDRSVQHLKLLSLTRHDQEEMLFAEIGAPHLRRRAVIAQSEPEPLMKKIIILVIVALPLATGSLTVMTAHPHRAGATPDSDRDGR